MDKNFAKGRGSISNPAGRFERLVYDDADVDVVQPDEFAEDAPARPPTEFHRDSSASIVARNQSPDVGFEASINPYRGCEHGCVYCLVPETPVLHADMSWRPIGSTLVGDELVGFDEYPIGGSTRKFRRTMVEAVWWSRKPTRRIVTALGDVDTTAEHRWLGTYSRWYATERLALRELRALPMTPAVSFDEDYRIGYLGGLTLGDGTMRFEPGWRSDKLGFPSAYWRVAMTDREPLVRAVEYLKSFGIETHVKPFDADRRASTAMWKVESRSLPKLAVIDAVVHDERDSGSYWRGFVAGFFDAEGHHGKSLRMSQVDLVVLERVRRYTSRLGFTFRIEYRPNQASTIRLVGSSSDRVRFLATCRPAIQRKIASIFGVEPAFSPEPVFAIENGHVQDVVDIQTSTGTFFAAGFASHNCYARPTHEFLGLSAGLDFETKIFVKEKAPELLRAKLMSRSWKPTPLALSGVTDPYQPIERRLKLTRRVLEVLAEFRNPVIVVTKNHLVTRDVDLLAALAEHAAVRVYLSVTTLDAALARTMEPRTSSPERRLEAIATLARAGVPTGVLVAPVVPALTDSEIPRILEACAAAGARYAGHVVLRLPHGVKEIFEEWLATHYPDRREKILARVRALRDGTLYQSNFGERM
ncbi:MAG: radical SAM protein, partial [Candidatus Latescibacteria bacterium]|nr:radical SAM protein [Candidatus Latescibacterota bacterium]